MKDLSLKDKRTCDSIMKIISIEDFSIDKALIEIDLLIGRDIQAKDIVHVMKKLNDTYARRHINFLRSFPMSFSESNPASSEEVLKNFFMLCFESPAFDAALLSTSLVENQARELIDTAKKMIDGHVTMTLAGDQYEIWMEFLDLLEEKKKKKLS